MKYKKSSSIMMLLISVFFTVSLQANVLEKLQSIPEISDVIEEPCGEYVNYNAQCFSMMVTQSVDHLQPRQNTFKQRIRIIHRSFDSPIALRTRGYTVYEDNKNYKYYPIEPTRLIEGNLIDVEHRYL